MVRGGMDEEEAVRRQHIDSAQTSEELLRDGPLVMIAFSAYLLPAPPTRTPFGKATAGEQLRSLAGGDSPARFQSDVLPIATRCHGE